MFLVRSHRDCDDLEGHCLHCDAFDGFPTPYEQTGTVAPAFSHVLSAIRHHPDAAIGGRSRRIRSKMRRNTFRGTATSAIWKTTERA